MQLAATALSQALLALRRLLGAALDLGVQQLTLGTPAQAQQLQQDAQDQTLLNLFVYQLLPAGYPADAASDGPDYWRAHCLITPMAGRAAGDGPSAGEIDLRMLSTVAAALHAHPVIEVKSPDGQCVAQLQVVPHPLPLEDMSHLWTAQNGVPLRSSLAYELGLLPTPFVEARSTSSRVAEVKVRVLPKLHPAREPVMPPLAPTVSSGGPGLSLFWLTDDGVPTQTITLHPGNAGNAALIAVGPRGTTLTLHWEFWQPGQAWQTLAFTGQFEAETESLPERADPAALNDLARTLALPPAVATAASGQALVRASARVPAESGRNADVGAAGGDLIELFSNALLLTIEPDVGVN